VKRALAVVALVAAVLPAAGAPRATATLNVFAASSLTEVFPRIDRKPNYNFAGSNQLALQIRQGAPAAVFASASPEYTRALFRERLVERPRVFATNSLVLAVPASNPAALRTVFDLRRGDVKLVIGSASVPIGIYTRAVLKRLGLSTVLASVVSEEPDVKSIVGKLALGEADAGFVYRTDVRAAAGRLRAIALPARAQPTVRYEVAVVRGSSSTAAARRWVQALSTHHARQALTAAGFGVPKK
jgi:molybdate transport system substrate-binding protein